MTCAPRSTPTRRGSTRGEDFRAMSPEGRKPSIVFVGFMGAGKSTALAAARGEGLPTVEIDSLMEASFGSTIPQAFERHGEEGFRAREAEVVGSLLEEADDGGGIALGGGRLLSPRVPAAMARHTVASLAG